MNAEDALKELRLRGSGTIDSLTVDLDSGKHVVITRQEAADLPVDLIRLAKQYFELVTEAIPRMTAAMVRADAEEEIAKDPDAAKWTP